MPNTVESSRSTMKAHWRSHIEFWERSGMNLAAYARLNDISYSVLGYWKRKLDKEKLAAGSLPLIIQFPSSALLESESSAHIPAQKQTFTLRIGAYALDIPENFAEPTLVRLLDCLERR